jgi:hypothetical protein
VTHYRLRRDAQNPGRFFNAKAAEKSQLDHAALAGIDLGQRRQRIVQRQHFDSARPIP